MTILYYTLTQLQLDNLDNLDNWISKLFKEYLTHFDIEKLATDVDKSELMSHSKGKKVPAILENLSKGSQTRLMKLRSANNRYILWSKRDGPIAWWDVGVSTPLYVELL